MGVYARKGGAGMILLLLAINILEIAFSTDENGGAATQPGDEVSSLLASSQRVLLQTTATRQPGSASGCWGLSVRPCALIRLIRAGDLVGNVGIGLFFCILFGVLSVVGCLFAEGTENPG